MKYELWTDGALRSKVVGAWACVIVKDEKEIERHSGMDFQSTNNRMEMTGVIEGLKRFNPATAEVEVVSDSAYVVNCFLQEWYVKWRKQSWRNSFGEDVKNKDLWEEMLRLVEAFEHPVKWRHVKGHSGVKWNELADEICNQRYLNAGIGVK